MRVSEAVAFGLGAWIGGRHLSPADAPKGALMMVAGFVIGGLIWRGARAVVTGWLTPK